MNQGRAIQIVVEFGRSLFGLAMANGGIQQWNALMSNLFDRELIFPYWTSAQRPPPLIVMIALSGMDMSHKRLDGINLSFCWMEEVDFTGSSLKGARLGCCPGSCFKDAKLDGASIGGEISGCSFEGASLEGVIMDGAGCDPMRPPTGLPSELLAACKPELELPRTAGGRDRETHVACCATLHVMPMEAP